MTVKDLIEALQKIPPEYPVVDDCNDEILRAIIVDSSFGKLKERYVMLKTIWGDPDTRTWGE